MNPHIRNQLLMLACITCSNLLFAHDDHSSPGKFSANTFIASLKTFDAMNNAPVTAKVCACQILNLYSKNHHLENAVVFAEKTQDGSTDISTARNRLEKEKKHLKLFFFDKINVVTETTAATDCNSLFVQLKKQHEHLIMYEVLNADVVVR